MFKFNLIQKAIDCATGNIIPTQQIVNACLTDGKVVSLVFDNAKVVIVQDGIIMYSDLNSAVTNELTCFFGQNKQLRHTRKIVKRLETELKSFYPVPDGKKKFIEVDMVVDLQDLAEGDTIVLRNGTQLKVDIISCLEPNRVTISDGNMYIDCHADGTSHRGQCPHNDVVQIIKA
jgi:hypothetical protein